jgi:Icc-related predicted phosphoesterase
MILVVGDIHGKFNRLNKLISKKKPEIILQVGDFGYWPRFKEKYEIKNGETKIYFCDGNHEDHEQLRQLENNEIYKNVYYMKRGSTLTLPNGKTILFMGGAFSVDYMYRTAGINWFPQLELISEKDLENLPDTKIDIVISHTAPEEFYVGFPPTNDKSRKYLSDILNKYRPEEWYFGHFHMHKTGFDLGCKWTALSCVELDIFKWWVSIDKAKDNYI